MKTLYIVRHAKSSWEHDGIDHDRPLNSRGKKDIVLMAEEIASKINQPDLMISSTTNRAFTTALQFKDSFNMPDKKFKSNPNLYDFSGGKVLKVIKDCNNDVDSLMIFGHNNALTNLVNSLGDKYIDNLPTCGFVQIEFENDNWADITKGKTIYTLFPKDLKK